MQATPPYDGELGGLPAFARIVGSRPHADQIAAGLVDGPLARYGAVTAVLMWTRDTSLRLLSLYGYAEEETDGFDELPLSADLPICRAAREGEVIVGSIATMDGEYSDTPVDDPRWERVRSRMRMGSIVGVPVVGRGRTLGAFVFTCRDEREWLANDIALLDALGHMIALWMLHPDSQLPWPGAPGSDAELTDRQCRIVSLILAGKTNGAIAATLGYSESTVKQEISRVMRVLGCSTRTAAAERAADLGLCHGGTP